MVLFDLFHKLFHVQGVDMVVCFLFHELFGVQAVDMVVCDLFQDLFGVHGVDTVCNLFHELFGVQGVDIGCAVCFRSCLVFRALTWWCVTSEQTPSSLTRVLGTTSFSWPPSTVLGT